MTTLTPAVSTSAETLSIIGRAISLIFLPFWCKKGLLLYLGKWAVRQTPSHEIRGTVVKCIFRSFPHPFFFLHFPLFFTFFLSFLHFSSLFSNFSSFFTFFLSFYIFPLYFTFFLFFYIFPLFLHFSSLCYIFPLSFLHFSSLFSHFSSFFFFTFFLFFFTFSSLFTFTKTISSANYLSLTFHHSPENFPTSWF